MYLLDETENLGDGQRNDARRVDSALHGVRLSGRRLPVGKDGAIYALKGRVYDVLGQRVVDVDRLRIVAEHVVCIFLRMHHNKEDYKRGEEKESKRA